MPLSSDPRCLECFRNGFGAFFGRGSAESPELGRALQEALAMVEERLHHHAPPVAGAPGYTYLCRHLGVDDLFAGEKRALTQGLLSQLDRIRPGIAASPRPSAVALRAGVWGNLLDVAQGHRLPDADELQELFDHPLALDDTGEFLDRLNSASLLLILGDNAGETVLDRLFLETASPGAEVVYTVRPEPVMNDATAADAEMAGLHRLAELVETGCAAPTIMPGMVSPRLERLLGEADLVLSKGQGNLEGLLGTSDERLFYSFVVKCEVIADATGLPLRSGVFARSTRLPQRR